MKYKQFIHLKKPVLACVLKSGGDFLPYHVEALACQVASNTSVDYEFVCLTDFEIEIPGVRTIPLLNNWPGWWSCVEIYRIVGQVIAFDLDTVVLGNIDQLFEMAEKASSDQFYMLQSFRPPVRGMTGIVAYNGDWTAIYKGFDYAFHSGIFRGDDNYVNSEMQRYRVASSLIQKQFKGIYSYKRHCQLSIPEDCRILVFHGKPRPFHVPEVWDKIVEECL